MANDDAVVLQTTDLGPSQQTLVPKITQQMSQDNELRLYTGASTLSMTEEERKLLMEPTDDDYFEIRPDGLVYLPQIYVREKLSKVFGPGQWSILQIRVGRDGNVVTFDGALIVRGCFIARAMGEAEHQESNKSVTIATTLESAKSNCLIRCAKDLGIAQEAWQPAFRRKWVAEKCIKVYAKQKWKWRRKDAEPLEGESTFPLYNDKVEQFKTVEELKKWWEETKASADYVKFEDSEKRVLGEKVLMWKNVLTPKPEPSEVSNA